MGKLTPAIWAGLAVARLDLKETCGRFIPLFTLLFTSCMSLIIISLILSHNAAGLTSRLIYLFPGLVGGLCLSGLTGVSGMIQSDMRSGAVVVLLLSPAAPAVLLVGHLISLAIKVLIQAGFLFLVTSLVVGESVLGNPGALAAATGAVVLGVVFYGSLGAILAVANPMQAMNQIMTMVLMSFSVIASTAYFTLDRVPGALRGIAEVNPISFMCEAMRFAFCAECRVFSWEPLLVVGAQALVAFGLACVAMGRIDRRADA